MSPAMRKGLLVGQQEIADYLAVSKGEVPNLIKNNNLPVFYYSGKWRAVELDLDEWMNNLKNNDSQ